MIEISKLEIQTQFFVNNYFCVAPMPKIEADSCSARHDASAQLQETLSNQGKLVVYITHYVNYS